MGEKNVMQYCRERGFINNKKVYIYIYIYITKNTIKNLVHSYTILTCKNPS